MAWIVQDMASIHISIVCFLRVRLGNDNNNVVILRKSGCCEYQQNNIYSSHYSKYCFVDSYSL